MSSPEKKRKKKAAKKPTPNVYIPDDLLLTCIAPRVSRFCYPTLSLVSKSLRSLVASPEIYNTRSHIDRTESCLYVCLSLPPNPNPSWFALCPRPNRNLTKKNKQSSKILVPISSPHLTPVRASFVVLGSDIYEIGGLINGVPSTRVSIFDCRSHSWHQAPDLQVAREYPYATATDGKIYVSRGLDSCNSSYQVEVFDPKTKTWTYESREWSGWKSSMSEYYGSASRLCCSCVIGNVAYLYHEGEFKWSTCSNVQLADYGGKMAVLWDRHDRSSNFKGRTVWCAKIALEKRTSEEIWGMVEWCEPVLKVPGSVSLVDALAACV
ncbi:unnamed protein product [Microthlaspi erraticum]|uniref:FKB95-like N-terminal Kelch domain-containing protein n=1 Tax=Microthlaspi erraticum TaxID=1685480 RepID=A0A6D2JL30_9BRAS|nr:unnamed protein product [Microthlaspi erraticum]